MFSADNKLNKALEKRKLEGALRTLNVDDGTIDFCSNDYLGFARADELREYIRKFIDTIKDEYHIGSTGSRLISGNSVFVEYLEAFIADYHHAETGLIFNSGYDANIGLLSSVPQRGDTIFYDELMHASVRDGIRLSHADSYSFRHNDIEHLKKLFEKAKGDVFVIVETIYSMDGDSPPLAELAELCKKKNANLIVDEAHATGVIGEQGKGLVSELGLEKEVFARMHTFGKALGCHGAIVLGNNTLRNYLINFARSFFYTTALLFHSYISVKCAYDLLAESQDTINKLHANITYFKERASAFKMIESSGPMQCIIIEGNEKVCAVAKHIHNDGFNIKAVMSPTVPKGKERLRICIHAFNTEKEIDELLRSISQAIVS